MLAKENIKQLELFTELKKADREEAFLKKPFLLSRLLDHERFIFIFISLLVIFIFGFSLGVERGKKINKIFDANQKEVLNEKIVAPSSDKVPQETITNKTISSFSPAEKEKKDKKTKLGPTEIPKKYTIQVASYSSRKSAQKELATLEKKGYTTFIIPKGRFNVVCVGEFLDKNTARSPLLELKRKYQDCLIRSL